LNIVCFVIFKIATGIQMSLLDFKKIHTSNNLSFGERMYRKIACNPLVSSRRKKSIQFLANNPSARSVDALFDVLDDVDINVSQYALDSLLVLGTDQIIEKLLCKIKDGNPITQHMIINAMSSILIDTSNEIYDTARQSLGEPNYEFAEKILTEIYTDNRNYLITSLSHELLNYLSNYHEQKKLVKINV